MKAPRAVEVDIDLRIMPLWDVVRGSILMSELTDQERRDDLGTLIRYAYLAGYRDANTEAHRGCLGRLYDDNNIQVI